MTVTAMQMAEKRVYAQRSLAIKDRITRHRGICGIAWVRGAWSGRSHSGKAWSTIQQTSPALCRERVRFADLPAEIAKAQRILAEHDPRWLGR
jgi:hypothetical protein